MTQITETALRDAHQSLFATRMKAEHALTAAPLLDRVGYAALEAWGGATFDVCLRFLAEDPWDRLIRLKQAAPHTPIQMLLRGQNLVGYRHYADDVVKAFVRLAAKNGVDVFRVFDALNDTRNMATAIAAAKSEKKHVQGAIAYTTSPVHTIEKFTELAVTLRDLGSDSICIKDMSGLISPAAAYSLVTAIKKQTGLPVHLHSHCTSGLAPMAYQAAIAAGVDCLDCAISPLSGGTSQPATETVAYVLGETAAGSGLDATALAAATEYFKEVRVFYQKYINPISEQLDARVVHYQIPGGMLSNLLSQLKEQKALHRLSEVLEEVPRVRATLGFPPLVTPTSQIVGVQASLNVLLGSYKIIGKETVELIRGAYGRTPVPIDPAFQKKAAGKLPIIEGRPADYLEPELPGLREKYGKNEFVKREEDLLTLAMNPDVGLRFLSGTTQAEL